MNGAPPGVSLSRVSVTFGTGQQALDAIDLTIVPGEHVAVIGPSGAGKTTLLQLLATGLSPSSGMLTLLGIQVSPLRSRQLRRLRNRIGLIHQLPPLPPRQRVITAVLAGKLGQWSLAKCLLSLVYPVDIAGATTVLARLDLAEKLFAHCSELSGGQLQRVGIARVLYQAPELVLADEPVSAMDPVLAAHTLKTLCSDATQRQSTLIASLHAVELALAHFPRIIGLREGRIVFDRASNTVTAADLAALYANAHALQNDAAVKTATTALAMPGY